MEQAILGAVGGRGENKASTDLMKMIDAASGKRKVRDNQSGKGEEDLNTLVPFLQYLNQQLSQTNKSSDAPAKTNGEKMTLEQATLLFQGDINLKELQQALSNLAQSGGAAETDQAKNSQPGFIFAALLKEMDLLKMNLAGVDEQGKDLLIAAALEQAGTGEKVLEGENKTVGATAATFEQAGTEEKVLEGENKTVGATAATFEQAGTEEKVLKGENKTVGAMSANFEQAGTEEKVLKGENKTIEAIAAALNSEPKVKSGNSENEQKIINDKMDLKNFTGTKSDAGTLQPEKMIFQDAQLSESTAGKIAVNLTAVKEQNKIGSDIPPAELGKEDYDVRHNSRLSTQEIKESLISKDNYRFAGDQYSNAAKENSGNKAEVDTMQAILGERSGPIKVEQKGKIISGEKGNEEMSLSSVNSAGSGSVNMEKIKDVSPDKIISQITSEIKEVAANDGGRVKITLNPPSLGKVEMDVTVRNGKVEVVLVADNKDVQQSLNTHIDKLKGSLHNQGLTIDRCDVLMQDKREEYQQSFSQHAFYQQSRSGQDSHSRRENSEEEVKANVIIAERPASAAKVLTDNISLFA